MVLFVDLDEEIEPPEIRRPGGMQMTGKAWMQNGIPTRSDIIEGMAAPPGAGGLEERINPNRNALTEAMGCYP
jgi:hypothetical protein